MDCISVSWPGSPVCLQFGFPPPCLPPRAGRLGLVFILRSGAAPLEHRRQAGAGSCANTERLWGGGGGWQEGRQIVDPRKAFLIKLALDVFFVVYLMFYIGILVVFVKLANNWWDLWPGVFIVSPLCIGMLLGMLYLTPKMKVVYIFSSMPRSGPYEMMIIALNYWHLRNKAMND